ncbi:MAG: mannose-1-phosphate guanylyltransferase/mannose-6-phosphate isomerase [Alphaproteobacteria bacterium]|nr:mannose-1-phosphate guanylyltransferase/mannose-6-phosphate isomerase [Alphaproteobacteria bacterium]
MNITPVIMSGGSGTRLWPLSRSAFPKQFLNLIGDKSQFQKTALLLAERYGPPVIVCNEDHRFVALEQLRDIHLEPLEMILEPVQRNTAPAVTSACAYLDAAQRPAALFVPSDLEIGRPDAFHEAIDAGRMSLANERIVMFGVRPTRAETGYGYIEQGERLAGATNTYAIASFEEKPSLERAQQLIETERYFWNSAIFLAPVGLLREELERCCPEVYKFVGKAFSEARQDLSFLRLETTFFEASPNISIDKAVMEKTSSGVVVQADCEWRDLGSWPAVAENETRDEFGNARRGDVLFVETTGSYVRSDGPMVATLGVSDLTVVATDDAILIASNRHSQNVRQLVDLLSQTGRQEHVTHTTVYRPWGHYQELDSGIGFKVKRIVVKPGAALSLQKHYHRSEHWIVVKGKAAVTRGNEETVLSSNQSMYIPQETVHRLVNNEDHPLELIEVQTGAVLSEDDIERFVDEYGR